MSEGESVKERERERERSFIPTLHRVLQLTTFIERNLACESEQERCVCVCVCGMKARVGTYVPSPPQNGVD